MLTNRADFAYLAPPEARCGKIIMLWLVAMLASASAFANCSGWATGVSGQIIYIAPDMKYCDGTTWRQLGMPPCSHALIWSTTNNDWECASIPTSCKEVLSMGIGYSNGTYTINPGTGNMSVYCNMTVDGGGWTLVVSHNYVTTPTASGTVSLNSGTFLNDTIYTALNNTATEYLFYTANPGTYYYKMPKSWASLANCQSMSSASPMYFNTWYAYGWKDDGCDQSVAISGVDFGYSGAYFQFWATLGSPGSYSTTGPSGPWVPLTSSAVSSPNGGADYLMGFVR